MFFGVSFATNWRGGSQPGFIWTLQVHKNFLASHTKKYLFEAPWYYFNGPQNNLTFKHYFIINFST